MTKAVQFFLAAFLLLFSVNSFACVGKTLIIGALNTPNDQLLAQMMAVIINERTGTTVNVEYFENEAQLIEAVKKREINIYTENTARALAQLGKEASGDENSIYAAVKEEYKNQLHLVMLKPFGTSPAGGGDGVNVDVPVVAAGMLIDYPALPRVIEKLAGIIQDKNYAKLLAAVESGDKPNQVARDFLKKKRFI